MNKWLYVVLGLCLHSSVMATTIWAPTPGADANFLFTTSYSADAGTLALFDDQDLGFNGPHLALSAFDHVDFVSTGTGYQATNSTGGSLLLSNTFNFILGFTIDNGATWFSDTSAFQIGDVNLYYIMFNGLGGTLANVVKVSVAPVPLPAAIWLFLSGIAGLAGFKRLFH